MLEIYTSEEAKRVGARVIYKVSEQKEIADDCWVNLYSPTEDEISRVERELNIRRSSSGIRWMKRERPRVDFDETTSSHLSSWIYHTQERTR